MDIEERFVQGRKKAMALLMHNDRTRWELCDRLGRAGFEQEVIEDAVAYVESFHYIDDLRYATRFAEIYSETRSIQRIRFDLQKRHVPEEYIDIALENIGWDDSAALEKELRKLTKEKDAEELSYQERQKLAAKLYRKGFRTEDIFSCLNCGE
ncbi:regulatory protein RecX [bacterium D16-51]|nr:regulatory protein RecX [bacterium D16-59]RKI62066.1 regulatory protein RecX [bacterium D16-51]